MGIADIETLHYTSYMHTNIHAYIHIHIYAFTCLGTCWDYIKQPSMHWDQMLSLSATPDADACK